MARARRARPSGRARAKASERATLLASRQFRLLIDTVPHAMVVLNDQGEIVIVNSRTEKLFGYSAAELIGKKVEVIVPEGFAERRTQAQAAEASRVPEGFEERRAQAQAAEASRVLRARRRDGSEFPAEIDFSPLETDEGVLLSGFIRERLANSEQQYRSLFEEMPLALFRTGPDGTIHEANPAMLSLLGFPSREALLATNAADHYVDPGDRARYLEELERSGLVRGFETRLRRRDGREILVELSALPVRGADGRILRIEGSLADVTERRDLQAQLIQAQKMEAVGMLAGGIAHDFNNLLGAITMFGELAAADLPEGDQRRDDLDSIQEAVTRATTLTRQLLTFSRQQVVHPKVLDPNVVITNVLKILGRLIGEDIELVTELDHSAGLVLADESQLEQVLMNLAVNARDAMPTGGQLTITTSPIHLDELTARVRGLERGGDFLVLSVTDTGTGMPTEVQAHVFEPFFTTKGAKGTGLGLATVYGIVKQSGGHVGVASEPGRGSTFRIHLPAVSGLAAEHQTVASQSEASGGTETVLVVEDDPAVRLAVSSVLSRLGYTVLVARTAEDALVKAREHQGPIDLVLSDVVMPGMDGPDLITRLRNVRKDVKALLTSGYAGDAIEQHRVIESGVPFLEKPFTAADLAQRVREVLDDEAGLEPE